MKFLTLTGEVGVMAALMLFMRGELVVDCLTGDFPAKFEKEKPVVLTGGVLPMFPKIGAVVVLAVSCQKKSSCRSSCRRSLGVVGADFCGNLFDFSDSSGRSSSILSQSSIAL